MKKVHQNLTELHITTTADDVRSIRSKTGKSPIDMCIQQQQLQQQCDDDGTELKVVHLNHHNHHQQQQHVSLLASPTCESNPIKFMKCCPSDKSNHSPVLLPPITTLTAASCLSAASSINQLTTSKSENNIFDKNLVLPMESFDVVSLSDLSDDFNASGSGSGSSCHHQHMNDLSRTQILNRLSDDSNLSIDGKFNRF